MSVRLILRQSTDTTLATQVGSAGISLSGGQKQRLALARAVYSRKEFIILDDIFSGLDAETEDQVFQRLFGTEGLFRQMGTTVLLVTHAVHRLLYSDHVISLDSSGHISEQGHFTHLKTSGGYVQGLTAKLRSNDDPRASEQPKPTVTDTPPFKMDADEHEAQAEELNRQSGDFAVYRYYFASIGWTRNLIFAIVVVLYGVASKMSQLLLTYCKC